MTAPSLRNTSLVLAALPLLSIVVVFILSITPAWAQASDSVVVFNEVMYHPADEKTQPEWVELYNQLSMDLDLSRWRLDGGIRYEFAAGTIIPGRGFLVIASDPQIFSSSPLDVGTASTTVVEGKGWINVREIRLVGRPLDVTWSVGKGSKNADTWSVTLPLKTGTNDYTLEARDYRGDLIDRVILIHRRRGEKSVFFRTADSPSALS